MRKSCEAVNTRDIIMVQYSFLQQKPIWRNRRLPSNWNTFLSIPYVVLHLVKPLDKLKYLRHHLVSQEFPLLSFFFFAAIHKLWITEMDHETSANFCPKVEIRSLFPQLHVLHAEVFKFRLSHAQWKNLR